MQERQGGHNSNATAYIYIYFYKLNYCICFYLLECFLAAISYLLSFRIDYEYMYLYKNCKFLIYLNVVYKNKNYVLFI